MTDAELEELVALVCKSRLSGLNLTEAARYVELRKIASPNIRVSQVPSYPDSFPPGFQDR